jgi:hypothetical protein
MKPKRVRFENLSPLNDDEIYQKKRKAWLQGEGLHLNTAQINMLSLEHKWAIEIIGNLTYGKP